MNILGFDLDGVLYNWQEVVYRYCQMYLDIKTDFATFWTTEFPSYPKNKIEFFLNETSMYSSYNPSFELVEEMHKLAKNYDIVYITGRPACAKSNTEAWLRKNKFPHCEYFYLTQDKRLTVSQMRCDYYVEDIATNALGLKNITNVILFAQPWNVSIHNQFRVIYNINQLGNTLMEIDNGL